MLRILLPVDGSPTALGAVRHVMQLVHHGLRAHVVLAHVEREASLYEMVTARDPDVLQGVAEGAADDAFRPAEELLRGMQVPFERELALGDPSRVLLEICERQQCGMVVMGTEETSDMHSAVFGSVSHAVANHCPVPVTLVRRVPADTRD